MERRRTMSERWLTGLREIDRVEPSPDLLDRAESGPFLPDPRIPAWVRVRTVLFALLIAVAGSWATFAGLRSIDGNREKAADGPRAFSALWPETSLELAQRTQERADAGDTAVQWRIDSGSVALRYAGEVLAWPDPIAGTTGTDDPDTVIVSVHGPDASCSGAECQEPHPPQEIVTLTLKRLVRPGEGGIWSVTAVDNGS
jgi:hypothetical protein